MFIIIRNLVRSISLRINTTPCFSPDTTVSKYEITTRAYQVPASKIDIIGMFLVTFSVLLSTNSYAMETLTFSDEEKRIIASLAGRNLQPVRDETNSISGNTDAIAVGKALFFEERKVDHWVCHFFLSSIEKIEDDQSCQKTGEEKDRSESPVLYLV